MDYSAIGKKIRELRKEVGLTQGDLAKDICTQALISRIEKGDIYPSATSLYQISKKLGVDVNYFFEIGSTPRLDYVKEVERQLRTFRIKLKYNEMMEVVQLEESNPLFYKDPANLQLLLWHKSIYLFEVEKEHEKAMKSLREAYQLTAAPKKVMSEREVEILMTLGVFTFNVGKLKQSMEYYEKVKVALKTMEHLTDKSIKTRLLYNIARSLSRSGHYEESTNYCEEAIRWCVKEEHLWGLGELYYHIGHNFEQQGEYHHALPYIEKSLIIFEMRQNHGYHSYIIKKKEQIMDKIRETEKR
ncbi:helix-turn-helix transcriptional regulator [Rossellomorea aquimaris]|uniref:helix-turn-helix domain-containing protein n=1 Tax=Rossellomorea aquimaris TaxID=189382 RepID=UPI001CD6FA0B|nr:helix-turn-helix domain-containing protein [Rossellomorea aquimaris]MCA1055279.1 helix-turn-helix transcriptional regulator [Rossellomorea aquimaris]